MWLKTVSSTFQWVIITTLYVSMPKARYQETAQSSVNKLLLILWHNRLPEQQYDLLKTPLILALSAYTSKTSSVTPIFYYRIAISMKRCNFLQSLKNILRRGFRATLKFRKIKTIRQTQTLSLGKYRKLFPITLI